MTNSTQSVQETFTSATTGSNVLQVRSPTSASPRYITIVGTGTFSGTIKIVSGLPGAGAFGLVQNATFVITGSDGFSTVIVTGDAEDFRVDCSAYTSGTLNVTARYR